MERGMLDAQGSRDKHGGSWKHRKFGLARE